MYCCKKCAKYAQRHFNIFPRMHMVVHMTLMLLTVRWDDEWLQKPQSPCHCLM